MKVTALNLKITQKTKMKIKQIRIIKKIILNKTQV